MEQITGVFGRYTNGTHLAVLRTTRSPIAEEKITNIQIYSNSNSAVINEVVSALLENIFKYIRYNYGAVLLIKHYKSPPDFAGQTTPVQITLFSCTINYASNVVLYKVQF